MMGTLAIIENNATLTDPITIAHTFNKYFSTIALDTNPLLDVKKSFLTSSHQQIVIHFLFHLLIGMKFLTFLPWIIINLKNQIVFQTDIFQYTFKQRYI